MKLKNKYGFTLIELLAVIVVLAIIALIATPIVMNTIKNAKKGAAERSADSYIRQVETAVAEARLNHKKIPNGTYQIDEEGNLTGTGLPDGKLKIEMNGKKPTEGTITISNGEVENSSTMTIGDYSLVYSDNKWTVMKAETNRLSYNLKNVSGEKITAISSTETKTLTFTANAGYQLPDSITVTGATHIWDKETGTLILSKATGDVVVTIVGEEKITVVYRWSTDEIEKNSIINPNDTSKFTKDASTLGRNYYLKHVLDKENKVTESYACSIFNSKEYCLRGGDSSFFGYAENEADYTGNMLILKSLRDTKISCTFNASRSSCDDASVYLDADSDGSVCAADDEGFCGVSDGGSSYCIS